ncbi:ester cyclase [Heyndrickxia oleronia]|uniref:ester cyclase n=1 Tax=Heyndrickxia oleronia TaxID=38875 RepID=UPI00203E3734|nr:ester cyclase [Heyndrickxia oleronia]MCM3454554.1 ester cyclase [Heyndrickxia oleronia]
MTPEQVVRNFLEIVRSGENPEFSNELMADSVMAHQVVSEEEQTIQRTPQEYAEHVKEMIETYGNFSFEIQEFISQGNKVYVRWKQEGKHQGNIGKYQTTGLPLVESASAVYRVEDEKIAEYWIQIDRLGINKQLERNASN